MLITYALQSRYDYSCDQNVSVQVGGMDFRRSDRGLQPGNSDQPGAIADLQKAARIFSNQGNRAGYQQTIDLIQMLQQSPTPKYFTFLVCPKS